jgi:histidine ammonia-lyase
MLVIDGTRLTLADVESVALGMRAVSLSDSAAARVAAAYDRVQEWGRNRRPMYGVNTGFGEMAHVSVPPQHAGQLRVNLLRGHAVGTGGTFDEAVVRAIMLARINSLARGYSGVGTGSLRLLMELLNARIHPVIPEQGSLGASGDLSPLSHMALPLIGEGEVVADGSRTDAATALGKHGLEPVQLGYKEGLALINGTSAMTGAASIALLHAFSLAETAVLLAGVLVQCLRGSTRAFDASGHELKGHPGQILVAGRLRSLLCGSALTREHAELMSEFEIAAAGADVVTDTSVYLQSAYSVRCVPQILGAVLDALGYCRTVVEQELHSCNDNPLIMDDAQTSFHGGNFHGQYVAMACDFMAIALTEIGVLAERQVNRLVDPAINGGLPDFLAARDGGLAIGMTGAQYLATSIASENLDLAAPSSVKSLPSNGQNQDIVWHTCGATGAPRPPRSWTGPRSGGSPPSPRMRCARCGASSATRGPAGSSPRCRRCPVMRPRSWT